MDLDRKTREEIGKGDSNEALRFQTGGNIRHPHPPFRGLFVVGGLLQTSITCITKTSGLWSGVNHHQSCQLLKVEWFQIIKQTKNCAMTNVASCLVAGFYSPINQTDSPQDESHIQNASTPVKNASCHISQWKSLLTVVGTTRSKLQSLVWHPPTRHRKVRLGLGVSTRSAPNTVKARTVMYHLSHSFHLHLDRYIFGRFFMIYSTSRSECFKTTRSKHQ